MNRISPFNCPSCGVEVSPNARGCRDCGSRLESWNVPAHPTEPESLEDDFNYEEFIEDEFGTESRLKPKHTSWFWWVVGVVLAIAFGAFLFRA